MHVENAVVTKYVKHLIEGSRPPSRSGNGKAHHVHVLTIADDTYSFRALGRKQWVFKHDTVTFDWEHHPSTGRRYIDEDTILVFDKNGRPVHRGIRGTKKWRSSDRDKKVERE